MDELYLQLNGSHPDAIVCSVGGGGLLNGIMLGLERYGWSDHVTVVGMETRGADSFAESIRAGHIVTLPGITSIARSLGVTRVSDKTWEFAQQENVKSIVLSDAQAAMACVSLAAEEKIIVEPACGVSVAACYQEVLRGIVPNFNKNSKVVIIVCGGKSLSQLYLTRGLLQLSVLGLLLK
jgi:L-serine/L-threonine ammonia-lyase